VDGQDGYHRALGVFGVLQALTSLALHCGHVAPIAFYLAAAIGFEGFGSARHRRFVAYIAPPPTALHRYQFALFSSLAAVPRTSSPRRRLHRCTDRLVCSSSCASRWRCLAC